MKNIDVSVIINAHKEGKIAAATIQSVDNAVQKAHSQGIKTEVIAILDKPDQNTIQTFNEYYEKSMISKIVHVIFGDIGLSRNEGVLNSKGKWIAFLDADDLFISNWLTDAFKTAEKETRKVVWHPEINIYFGSRRLVHVHIDMDDPEFYSAGLALTNYWTALNFSPRSLLTKVPYAPSNLKQQIGYEDWSWHLKVMEYGYIHKITPNTVHLIRTKNIENSLLLQTNDVGCLPAPSNYFKLSG